MTPMTHMTLYRSACLAFVASVLAGCGAEVATTAVTATKLQAEQAIQATAQAEKLKADIAEAAQRAQANASAAESQ